MVRRKWHLPSKQVGLCLPFPLSYKEVIDKINIFKVSCCQSCMTEQFCLHLALFFCSVKGGDCITCTFF